jgi:hypothetical protein
MKTPDILKRIGKRVYDGMKKHPIMSATAAALATAIASDQIINYLFDYSFLDPIYASIQTFDVSHGYAKAESGAGKDYNFVVENISRKNQLSPEELSILKENGNTIVNESEVSLPNYIEGDTFTAHATSDDAGNRLDGAIQGNNDDVFIIDNEQTKSYLDLSSLSCKGLVLLSAQNAYDKVKSMLAPKGVEEDPIDTPKVRVLRTYTFDVKGNVIKIQNH